MKKLLLVLLLIPILTIGQNHIGWPLQDMLNDKDFKELDNDSTVWLNNEYYASAHGVHNGIIYYSMAYYHEHEYIPYIVEYANERFVTISTTQWLQYHAGFTFLWELHYQKGIYYMTIKLNK